MKILKYISVFLTLILLFSCVSDEKDIFDDSSANRISAALTQYNEWLLVSEGGWLLEYYPEESQYGGFYLYLKFLPGEKVSITGERVLLEEDGEISTSFYALKSDTGPLLSFDTFNRVFHQFSDPQDDGYGYEGDYEFVIVEADKDSFELKGKKNGVRMTMTRLMNEEIWDEFQGQVNEMVGNYPGFILSLRVGEKEIDWNESTGIGRYLTIEAGEEITTSAPGVGYIYTPKGIKFREAITIDGQTVQNFENAANGSLVCVDEGTNAEILRIPLNKAFSTRRGQWRFDLDRMGPRFTTLWATIVDQFEKELDEELLSAYFLNRSQAFAFLTYSREDKMVYQGNFFLDFIPIEEEENQMSILYEGYADEMTGLIYYYYFTTFLNYMSDESPYILTMNSFKTPIEIEFRRTDNPDNVWFVVTKS